MLTLASCSGDGGDSGETQSTEAQAQTGESSESETVTEAATEPDVQTVDYGGAKIGVLLWAERPMDFDAETGDVVNDAIYSRTRTVEESCNVSFDIVEKDGAVSGYPTWINTLESSVLAGDDAYQLAGGYAYRLSYDSLNGNYVNLMSVSAIDFTSE